MKIRKTPWKRRETYTYVFANGDRIELRPGENGVTEADIKQIHAADDQEVNNNLKNAKPTLNDEEKAAQKKWMDEHPGETPEKNWSLSIDELTSSDDGCSTADRFADLADKTSACPYDADESDALFRLHEIVHSLTVRQKQVYHLVVEEDYNFTETARLLGISDTAVRKHFTAIQDRIKSDAVLKKIFYRGSD